MIESAASGLLAAVIVCATLYLQNRLTVSSHIHLRTLLLVLATVSALSYQTLSSISKLRRGLAKSYLGIPDILVQIHAPSQADRPLRWFWKGIISILFALSNGVVGLEGATAEWVMAARMYFRSRSSRWSDQHRRTDGSTVLAAAVSGAFCAPFAAILLPIELGMGGRTLSSAVAALTAFFGVKEGINILHLSSLMDFNSGLDGMDYRSFPLWMALAAIAIIGGFLGGGFIHLWTFFYKSLSQATRQNSLRWSAIKILIGAITLYLVVHIYPMSADFPQNLFRDLLANSFTTSYNSITGYGIHGGILFFSRTLMLGLMIASFGSVGIIWPLLTLGACMGLALQHFAIPGELGAYLPMMILAGAAAFLSAVMGTPISSAVLIYEFTGQVEAGIFALFVSQLADYVARGVSRPLVDQGLRLKGLAISQGRSISVLEAIKVCDVMVTDHETIHEKESLTQVSSKLMASKYPLLPVVSKNGTYTGMLTVDMVQARLEESKQNPTMSKFFEVRDLLFRSESKYKSVTADDSLAVTQSLFGELPCTPVLSKDGHVQGLLFVHHVRLAYEREVARRFLLSNNEPQ